MHVRDLSEGFRELKTAFGGFLENRSGLIQKDREGKLREVLANQILDKLPELTHVELEASCARDRSSKRVTICIKSITKLNF